MVSHKSDFRRRVDDMLQVQTRVFGEEIKFFPKSGGVFKINGVFDNSYQVIDPQTQETISSNNSTIGVNLNDIENNCVLKGDEFEIRDKRFRVIDSQEDGQGGSLCILQEVRRDEKTALRKYPRDFKE